MTKRRPMGKNRTGPVKKNMENKSENISSELNSKDDYIQYLTFALGNEIYGFPVNSVKEVVEYGRVFNVPRVPDYIQGVINLRGEVVPVINLSFRFYGSKSSITIFSSIIFVEIDHKGSIMLIGVVIDEVKAVTDIKQSEIVDTPDFGTKIRSDFIEKVGKTDGEFVILLNIDKVIDLDELSDFENFFEK